MPDFITLNISASPAGTFAGCRNPGGQNASTGEEAPIGLKIPVSGFPSKIYIIGRTNCQGTMFTGIMFYRIM
jgi:hypothetical protein